jgi:ABC-type phosphate/phosphonate transport system substrate-binding protein
MRTIAAAAATAVMALVSLGAAAAAAEQKAEAEGRKATLTVISTRSLVRSINETDAVAAAKAWIEVMAKRRKIDLAPRVLIVEAVAQARRMLQSGEADLVLMDGQEYLTLAGLSILEPVGSFGFARGGGHVNYALLANAAEGVTRLEDLAGKKVHIASRTAANPGRLWLESILKEARLGRMDQFFSVVKDYPRSNAACLPVFFGSAGACVAELNELDVMTELNPQLKTRLKQLAVSPALLDTVVGVRIGAVPHRAEVLEALADLDRDPQGKQILMLFKTHRIAPFEPGALEALRGLLGKTARQGQADAGAGRRPAQPAGSEP